MLIVADDFRAIAFRERGQIELLRKPIQEDWRKRRGRRVEKPVTATTLFPRGVVSAGILISIRVVTIVGTLTFLLSTSTYYKPVYLRTIAGLCIYSVIQ